MKLPSPETVAAYANCSPTMAAHFLSAVRMASDAEAADPALAGMVELQQAGSAPVPLLDSEALQTLARAAVSGLRLMCMNPTQRDHWRVRDDGSLWRVPVDKIGAYTRAEFNREGVIEDAPSPAPER